MSERIEEGTSLQYTLIREKNPGRLILTSKNFGNDEERNLINEMSDYLSHYSESHPKGNVYLDLSAANDFAGVSYYLLIKSLLALENKFLSQGLELKLKGIRKNSWLKKNIEIHGLSGLFAHPAKYKKRIIHHHN